VSPPELKLVPKDAPAPRRPASTRSRRATPKSEHTRTAILEAAVDCVVRYGFHGTHLSRVAEIAGVTRGCLQYYFLTTEDIAVALVRYVTQRHWEIYENRVLQSPPGRDVVELAIDAVADEPEHRYRIVRVELLSAARTTPVLQPVFVEMAQEWEERAKRFTARIFGNDALAETPQFRAARDLTHIVGDYLPLVVFPDDREGRIRAVREALRISLHTLWRTPSLDVPPEATKPRVRVPAARSPVAE
jgi:AcrR family transcriptional regulator